MPKCENLLNSNGINCCQNCNCKPISGYKEVVIIGNGPSGLCLSYFLAGNWPYWNKNRVSDEYLQMRLECCDNGESLVEQDFEYLCDGLEGRSNNPVSLLFDQLNHPDEDLGLNSPSCLTWKYDASKEIDHIVLGKASAPGGAWNDLNGTQLTISPGKWMELPDMSYSERESEKKSSFLKILNFSDESLKNSIPTNLQNLKTLSNKIFDDESRVSMYDVKNYYRDYVKQKCLEKYLLNCATVTNVRRICCNKLSCQNLFTNECKSGTYLSSSNQLLQRSYSTSSQYLWEVTGIIDKRSKKSSNLTLLKSDFMEFKFVCKHLVLASGASDLRNRLKVNGENLNFVLSSIKELEDKIKEDLIGLQKDPLLIVGSGLSAADAILLAQKYRIRIIHVIRRSVHDPNLVFKTLPSSSYPEYKRVYELMIKNCYCKTCNSKLNRSNTFPTFSSSNYSNDEQSNTNILYNKESLKNFILYDESKVKCFTSKRTCILNKIDKTANDFSPNQYSRIDDEDKQVPCIQTNLKNEEIEIKISYACVLVGFKSDLNFLPSSVQNELGIRPGKSLNIKKNPVSIDKYTHESTKVRNLYAMGPLIGDNFVRFGTGGALAITSRILTQKKEEKAEKPY